MVAGGKRIVENGGKIAGAVDIGRHDHLVAVKHFQLAMRFGRAGNDGRTIGLDAQHVERRDLRAGIGCRFRRTGQRGFGLCECGQRVGGIFRQILDDAARFACAVLGLGDEACGCGVETVRGGEIDDRGQRIHGCCLGACNRIGGGHLAIGKQRLQAGE
jgi:hypothetical protein